jgi:hypothetical protein
MANEIPLKVYRTERCPTCAAEPGEKCKSKYLDQELMGVHSSRMRAYENSHASELESNVTDYEKRECCDTDSRQYHLESCTNFKGYYDPMSDEPLKSPVLPEMNLPPELPPDVNQMEKIYGENELDRVLSGLDFLRDQVHATAIDKGWWENGERNFGEVVALMHTELSEAYEEYRNGHAMNEIYYNTEVQLTPGTNFSEAVANNASKPEGVPVELVDVLIRILDWAGYYKVSLGDIMAKKMHYNTTRPYRHGNKKS